MTNRERVGRGLELLAGGLAPFVDERMSAAAPGGQDWLGLLAARDRSRFGADRRYSLNDARFLLRVVTEEWRVFRDHLSRVEQSFASELRDAGNKWAHGDEFSAADTYRALDTMERLLTAVHATTQAREARQLRLAAQPASVGAPEKKAEAPGRSGQSDRTPAARAGVYWSRVTRADVLQAIGEYEQLGQDEFLARYGFGRATAYLLIHNGRDYDSKAIAGVAYGFATGTPLLSREFNGGVQGAAGVLRKLGFEVRDVRGRTGTGAEPDPDLPSPMSSQAPGHARGRAADDMGSPAQALGGLDRDVPWTPDEVLDQLARAGTYAAEAGRSLLVWEKRQPVVEMTGGRGSSIGTLRFAAGTGDGSMLRLLLLYADPAGHPSLELHVANLLSVPPYDRDEAAGRLLAELRGLGIPRLLDDSVGDGIWPGIPLDQLTDGRIEQLLAVIDHWIDTIHA